MEAAHLSLLGNEAENRLHCETVLELSYETGPDFGARFAALELQR